jgi:TolB-like protein
MKHFTRFLALISIFLTIPWSVSAETKKPVIAVLDFQAQGPQFNRENMEATVATWCASALAIDGQVEVVDKERLGKVLEELHIYKSSRVEAAGAAQIGKALGVEYVITGSIITFQNLDEISIHIIDVESAAIIAEESQKIATGSNSQNAVAELSRKIIKSIQLRGYIVNRNGNSVTLDLGIDTGVQVGMQFVVFKEAQEIKHPKTGEVLGVERIQTGKVTITEITQKVCTAQIDEETSPGLVSYGQLVRSQGTGSPAETRLFVNTHPTGARIRILNIGPGYTRGMALNPGSYHLEISAPGYQTRKEWINLGTNEAKTISFDLVAVTAPQKPSIASRQTQASSLTAQQARYLHLLQSRNDDNLREAGKDITRLRLTDPVILDAVERALADGYMLHNHDYEHVDAMSWLCKALGASGHGKYRSTLRTVSHNAPSFKLRNYAGRSLSEL